MQSVTINTDDDVVSAALGSMRNSERKATEPMYRTSINYVIFCDVNEYCILSYSLSMCVCVRESEAEEMDSHAILHIGYS